MAEQNPGDPAEFPEHQFRCVGVIDQITGGDAEETQRLVMAIERMIEQKLTLWKPK